MIQSWVYSYRISEAENAKRDLMDRNYFEWAQLVICENGMMAAWSDYGNFAHRWTWGGNSCNQGCFRRFLTRIDDSYLLGKISRRDEIDFRDTVKSIKETIIQYRKDNDWTKEEAREEWDWAWDIDNKIDLDRWYSDTRITDAWELISYDYPQQAQVFTKLCWPQLMRLVRGDLNYA